jgi:uncharacterized membrane protein YdjX (TVP38/TMEM64 family)
MAVFASLVFSFLLPHEAAAELVHFTIKLRVLGAMGWVLFAGAVTVVALVGIIPGSLLGIAAGALYGVVIGFLTSAIGIVAGAFVAFLLSRSLMRPWIAAALGKRARLNAFDNLVTEGSWRVVALLRVSPVMPFSLTSYALGLSGIATRDYLTGTLASLPALLGYVVIGALGTSTLTAKTRGDAIVHVAILTFGVVATLALTIYLTRLLARALRPTSAEC